ncbi:unnamed protein product [Rotaria sp. Silwood2]|nr:unnamed protein product [Rotaria sp. Silwood2]CAF3030365.1 unnamed protein product [Rotaria sp. Silwood2]CAF4539404.1 unnamed protein product [Rotaria sp. Silwood2]CAF4618328.1 unnamed protein product [Rotaria sp. Silwood2]
MIQNVDHQKNVVHLVGSDNKFIAPTIFRDIDNCQEYANEHCMKFIKELNKLSMSKQLDFPLKEATKVP